MEVKKFYLDKIAALHECIATAKTRTDDALLAVETMIGVIESQTNAEVMIFLKPSLSTIKSALTEMKTKADEIGTGESK